MGSPVSTPDVQPAAPAPARPHRGRWALLAVLGVVAVVLTVLVVGRQTLMRPVPAFPSLVDHPDPALHGTVAYLGEDGCIRVVPAAGGPSRQVWCLPPQDVAQAEKLGKEQGPQLVWRPDGRLEVTMFRMTDPPGPGFRAGWQKLLDVRTGQVEDVPQADVPSTANKTTHPSTSPTGQTVSWTSDPASGRIRVVLHEGDRSRTLLSAQGPGEYTYGLSAVFWSPDGAWIAADDGRILVITPGNAVTRVLVKPADVGFPGELARFAVTTEDVLPATR